jgi:hypothetical protein
MYWDESRSSTTTHTAATPMILTIVCVTHTRCTYMHHTHKIMAHDMDMDMDMAYAPAHDHLILET